VFQGGTLLALPHLRGILVEFASMTRMWSRPWRHPHPPPCRLNAPRTPFLSPERGTRRVRVYDENVIPSLTTSSSLPCRFRLLLLVSFPEQSCGQPPPEMVFAVCCRNYIFWKFSVKFAMNVPAEKPAQRGRRSDLDNAFRWMERCGPIAAKIYHVSDLAHGWCVNIDIPNSIIACTSTPRQKL